ncbi:splicing factor 45 [Contarinia nasturtii]|uniref:splicing factor 45 n=1 Tax=Contarinia nasturtii TaxID=265458 RepID=UPI0012D3FFC0|nr:splicing factor 45 [Contarinia nasturtii]
MDLYDDLDAKQRIDGWSPSLKLMQTQMALKKAIPPPPVKKELTKRTAPLLAPTTILKTKGRPNDSDDHFKSNDSLKSSHKKQPTITTQALAPPNKAANDYDWDVIDEYNPLWPNEYEKIIKDRRERRDNDRKRRNNRNEQNRNDSPPQKFSGFAGRSDDLDDYKKSPPNPSQRSIGAAIAPPPSLQESTPIIPALQNTNVSNSYGGGSVAAKIMAKYGFKDGQGLGKQEQGMSIALQVEKTSKRGGRIIHEKELMQPPTTSSPPALSMPPPIAPAPKEEPSITEIMKAPSKVVLLRNMVGAGDVDDELEGEVKDECNTKYGDVVKVIIVELKNTTPEEAVRIFVEFKRIESAIKAVVDLNGRFFGGRQVKAGFYALEKFQKHHLTD